MSKGKYSKNHGFNVRPLVLMLAVALLLGATVGGTLAWLTASTKDVVNTFTVGNIDITLEETDMEEVIDSEGNVTGYKKDDFKMVPGNTITKDPKVTVLENSEASWVFVKIEKSSNFDNFMTYEIADGWNVLNTEGLVTVYYRMQDATTADVDYPVLKDNKVLVKSTVTKAMMDALTDATLPKLTFTAAAVQQANIGTGDDATKAAAAYAELPAEFKN